MSSSASPKSSFPRNSMGTQQEASRQQPQPALHCPPAECGPVLSRNNPDNYQEAATTLSPTKAGCSLPVQVCFFFAYFSSALGDSNCPFYSHCVVNSLKVVTLSSIKPPLFKLLRDSSLLEQRLERAVGHFQPSLLRMEGTSGILMP